MKKLFYLLAFLGAALVFVSCEKEEKGTGWKVPETSSNGIIYSNQRLTSTYMQGGSALYNIYLPAGYDKSEEGFPVLYLLHGMWSNNLEWTEKGGVQNTTDNAVKAGTVGKYIVVMPNVYDSFYVDGYDGKNKTESFFWKELKPYIEKNYKVKTGRENTAIAGLSMGGFGASYYAFKYPDEFCFCYEMSGAVGGMGTEQVPSVQMMFEKWGYDKSNYDKLPYYIMDCGDDDSMCGTANVYINWWLNSVEFPHEYRHYSGGHDWDYWSRCYKDLVVDLGAFFKPEK